MSALWLVALTTLAAVLVLAGCAGEPSDRAASEAGDATEPSRVLLESGTVLQGRVIVGDQELPATIEIQNTTDPEHCGQTHSLENIIVSAEGGLKNTIVALKNASLPEGYQPPKSSLVLENRNCRFQPHVAVLTTGSTIEAVNKDPFYHSVHLYGLKQLNVALSASQSKLVQVPNRPGYVIVKCDVHGWMQAYFRVDKHPFHAVTDQDGRFQINGIPPGPHTLEVWHEYLGPMEYDVTVEPGSNSPLTIAYQAPDGSGKEGIAP